MNQEDDRLPDDWEMEQLRVYHEVYALSMPNQAMFSHPAADAILQAHWQTICHNFAFWAATAANGDDLTVTNDNGDVLMSSERGITQ